jgi:sugar phosphate isomerase/epimerase
LLEIPARLQQHGIGTLEICHFHLPSTDPTYLEALRHQLRVANVELFSVLIDTGDIVAPNPAQRSADLQLIRQWIATAAALGAERVRIDAGCQPPTPDIIQQSAQQLRALARDAAEAGLKVSTENWHITSQSPTALLAILDQCDGQVGLCVDTGNAEATADKYQTIAHLLPRATSIHLKARYAPTGEFDREDLSRCAALIQHANFNGVLTLIYDGKRDEWDRIGQLRDMLHMLV